MSISLLGFLLTFVISITVLTCSAVYIPKKSISVEQSSTDLSEKAEFAFEILRKSSSSAEEMKKGFELAMETARAGIPLGMKTVTASYFFGRGVERDYSRARQWAQRLAEHGDSSGKWIYLEAFMKDPENSCVDPETDATDIKRYRGLCERTIDQRADEIRAIDYGADITSQYKPAELFIASLLWSHPAEGNNELALKILEKFTPESKPKMAVLKYLTGLGSTIATYRIFHDTYAAASEYAGMKANAPARCGHIKLRKADVQGPVRDAVYLPLKSRKLQSRVLVKGTWDEKWIFSVCGKDVPVDINFQADGMGGARYSIEGSINSHSI